MRDVDVTFRQGKFQQDVTIGPHGFVADEDTDSGGEDAGPAPHEILLAALGACTSMTLKMYAERKGLKLDRVRVHLAMEKRDDRTILKRTVSLEGTLSPEERARLLEIAAKCPVHKTLAGEIDLPVTEAQ